MSSVSCLSFLFNLNIFKFINGENFQIQNTENIPPQVIKRILKEINDINSENIDGIKLIPNEQDICDIQAFIDGPGKTFRYNSNRIILKIILSELKNKIIILTHYIILFNFF